VKVHGMKQSMPRRRRRKRHVETVAVGFRFPKSVVRQLDYLVREEGFQSRSEFIRWLIRQEYELVKLGKALGEDLSVKAWVELIRRKRLISESNVSK